MSSPRADGLVGDGLQCGQRTCPAPNALALQDDLPVVLDAPCGGGGVVCSADGLGCHGIVPSFLLMTTVYHIRENLSSTF